MEDNSKKSSQKGQMSAEKTGPLRDLRGRAGAEANLDGDRRRVLNVTGGHPQRVRAHLAWAPVD
eukprot:5411623-Pyramimonas_sp.AAC.1